MSDYLEQLKSLQPLQIEGKRLDDLDQWPARQRCVFRECQFPHLHLTRQELSELRFERCSFGDVVIEGGSLDHVIFDRCKIQGLQVRGAELTHLSWHQCELGPWTMSQTLLKDTQVINSRLQSVAAQGVDGRHCSFVDTKLERLSLHGGRWMDWSLANTQATRVELVDVQLERLLWGRCRFELVALTHCTAQTLTWFDCQIGLVQMSELSGTNVSWQDSVISGGHLHRCVMPMVLMAGCRLHSLDMSGADISQAIFDNARLESCDLRSVAARRASFRAAHLQEVDFSGADLIGLNATGAVVSGLRLQGARCCDSVMHGQKESDWLGADLDDAEFAADSRLDDRPWWNATQPGPREGALV